MALPLNNDFEEAPSTGTTVTTGNSGGGPGSSNAFDSVTIGTSATVAYSSVQAAHGTYSVLCQTGGSSASAFVTWSTSMGAQSVLYGRAYVYLNATLPGASRLVEFFSGATYLGGIAFTSGHALVIQNAAFTFVQTFSTALPLSQWVRVEWAYTFGSSGSATVNMYSSADSTSVTEGHTVTAQNFGGAGATCNTADIGWAFNLASQPALYLDALNLNATALPGPWTATTVSGTAALSGSGTLSGAGVFAGAAALSGAGTLGGTGTVTLTRGQGIAALSGTGTLGAAGTGVFFQAATLSGTGTLTATWIGVLVQPPFTLDGEGTLQLSGVKLGFTAALSGNGTLSVLQATGGLVFASPGAAVPYAYPMSSQVMVAPPGTSRWCPLGSVGHVTALTYSFTCPGGADAMSCTVQVPASYRSQLFWPGWQVRITRGGHQVWSGKLDEPVPTSSGWTLTAVGDGNRGADFAAVYSGTWPSGLPDDAVNEAISRGLPWVNSGIGTPSGAWFGQSVDSGAQTVTDLLNLICTRGGLVWRVNSQPGGLPGTDLTVLPLPTVVNRLLTATTPVARSLAGDINTIWIRYQDAAADTSSGGSGAASFSLTSVQNAASVTAHGVIETYADLSNAGTMSAVAAQAVGSSVLQIYQRASYAGPFTARYGQLCTPGGQPIDPGADQAGTYVRLILTDFGYGGEVTPQFPVTFIVGSYTWDDLAQTATITPYQSVDLSLSGLLSVQSTVLAPVTASSGG